MNDQLPTLTKLLKQLQQVPYLASKNLYRVAHHFLQMDAQRLRSLMQPCKRRMRVLKSVTSVVLGKKTGRLQFCCSPRRDKALICVVETWYDLYAIEKTGGFKAFTMC